MVEIKFLLTGKLIKNEVFFLPAKTVENAFENQYRASGVQQGEGLPSEQGINSGIENAIV